MSLLSCPCARQLSQGASADVEFVGDKATVIGDIIKGTFVSNKRPGPLQNTFFDLLASN